MIIVMPFTVMQNKRNSSPFMAWTLGPCSIVPPRSARSHGRVAALEAAGNGDAWGEAVTLGLLDQQSEVS